jgi:DNA-binding response OmpR family regulator
VQFIFADHRLDTERRELYRGREQIAVEPQVFDLLAYLIENRDRVVSKDDIIARYGAAGLCRTPHSTAASMQPARPSATAARRND